MLKQKYRHYQGPQRYGAAGFSMIEAIISTALALVLASLAFTFFIQARKGVASEQSGIDLQQAARVSVDELARQLQQVGYGVDRSTSNNASLWQKSLVYGGPHAIALNMDVDATLGPMDSTVTLTFPTGHNV